MATKDAYFGFPGINFKVVVGGAHMTRLFPLNVVRRMILTGESLSADEAFKYGAINSIHDTKKDLYKEALKLAEIIANKDRKSLVLAKKSLNSTTYKRLNRENLKFIEFEKVNISSSQLRKI